MIRANKNCDQGRALWPTGSWGPSGTGGGSRACVLCFGELSRGHLPQNGLSGCAKWVAGMGAHAVSVVIHGPPAQTQLPTRAARVFTKSLPGRFLFRPSKRTSAPNEHRQQHLSSVGMGSLVRRYELTSLVKANGGREWVCVVADLDP